MSLAPFHPIVAKWFQQRFQTATEPQRLGWPAIASGRHTLIAAPTGSGKTLAAFLVCIDRLVRQALQGELADETQVVYVSPLKALSNDISRNLQTPLAEIQAGAAAAGLSLPALNAAVRTGDTPASQRQRMTRRPPHILVTTPESLYLLLTSAKAREGLRSVRTVVVDEIHALARDKRGSHLSLTLERLEVLCHRAPTRIGLSATQRPMEEIARYLVGAGNVDRHGAADCQIVDVGHVRRLDLGVEVPPSELSAVCSHETWAEVYHRLGQLIASHRSTLLFVNTRRLAERVSHHLGELLGEDAVASHHGSLSKELRLSAERRLQSGELKVIVATASLELGIDVGYIDLVCQLSSPRSIATFLQRIGRSGHSLGATPCGRLFPLTRDDLLEAMALVRAVKQQRLDCVEIPVAPLDIVAQQIVAAVAADEWDENELFERIRRSWPYRNLTRGEFDEVLQMLGEGVAPGMRRGAHLHRDRIQGRLRPRRGARLAAITSGGAIPDNADYRVVTQGDRTLVGTVNEDFAIESLAGDIFLLGNTSWRICHVRGGEVTVNDAEGAPATIPFWFGEAPGRTPELSQEVSQLREDIASRLPDESGQADATPASAEEPDTLAWLQDNCGVSDLAARQALNYVAAQVSAIGLAPSARRIVFERFFDESGGMQLVIHAPLGARVNRAWGLALRKRFCRTFDFELQASADDNGVVLSLGPQHSFAIDNLFKMLDTRNGRDLLIQALLAAPMFQVRWRWNVTRALAVLRRHGGKQVPPPLQRMRADDLLTAVFPATTACLENVVGDIEVPDHPLVRQTVYDCLHEAMDVDRWLALLADVEAGRVEFVARDTREPSPFCYELLNANPYAFLDDAPLEERRARAVATRRTLSPDDVAELAALDPTAIAQVRQEVWPTVRDADELHDALLSLGAAPSAECQDWEPWFDALVTQGRAVTAEPAGAPALWVATERWTLIEAVFAHVAPRPDFQLPAELRQKVSFTEAMLALVRGRMEIMGPTTAGDVAMALGLRQTAVEAAMEALEGQGAVLRGNFTSPVAPEGSEPKHEPGEPGKQVEWCDRRLLARIHRLTLESARRRVQPTSPRDFWRFLCDMHGLGVRPKLEGRQALRDVVSQLQGCEIAGGAWESDVLPGRIRDYDPAWLDDLALSGELSWGRLAPPRRPEAAPPSGAGVTRVVPLALMQRSDLIWLAPLDRPSPEQTARGAAQLVYETLTAHGALFFDDLLLATGLLRAQLEDALSELAAQGAVSSDSFSAIRKLVTPDSRRRVNARRKQRRGAATSRAGRWSRFPPVPLKADPATRLERWAWQLLRRWGVVFRDLLARETVAPQWRDLAPIYRRLEAQGKVRGGRFVSNVGGEQYAALDAVERLRQTRDAGGATPADKLPTSGVVYLSAADPLNLFGVILDDERVPSIASNTLAVIDGRLVAAYQGGETRFLASLPLEQRVAIAREIEMNAVARGRRQSLDLDLSVSR